MTVIAGLCCDAGLVIASDSQMSAGATRREEQKVWLSQDGQWAFGLAGAESSMHLLRDALQSLCLSGRPASEIGAETGQVFATVLGPEYARIRNMLPASQQSDWTLLPTADGVVGVFAVDGLPHIFHVNGLATVTDHVGRGFASAGTGGLFAEHAMAVFREFRAKPISLYQAKMLAFRVIEDAIAIGGPNVAVGLPVQMAEVTVDGSALLPKDEPLLKDAVLQWRRLEGERFRDHAPPQP